MATIEELVRFFSNAHRNGVKAVVLAGEGDHFCAGLDLVEHWKADRSPTISCMCACAGMKPSTRWNTAACRSSPRCKGAVVGGGLELASAAHIRVMDQSTYFALPEGQRGIFTGGGATIRVSDMIGKYRMIDMILTGRVYQGQEAVDLGLAQYITEGSSFDKALELADKVAQNLPLTNYAICSAISHLNNMSGMDAAYAEAVVAGVVNTQPAARERLEAFANKTAARVRPNS